VRRDPLWRKQDGRLDPLERGVGLQLTIDVFDARYRAVIVKILGKWGDSGLVEK
jgi:hypothetical protein